MSKNTAIVNITYLGPPGAGFGFQLAGMMTTECSSGDELLSSLKQLVADKKAGIVFVDESLAEGVMDEVEKLNENTMPAIVLLTNPVESKRLAAAKMDRLMIRAVGSDIFNN